MRASLLLPLVELSIAAPRFETSPAPARAQERKSDAPGRTNALADPAGDLLLPGRA